jgi:SAM-dependent methyltransferase|tara:strand:+ start:16077 stop:16640 length:564 start_codon:yes stop_codon:yes gene_type:complete
MASPNDLLYVKTVCPDIVGPILEVGSLDISVASFRNYFLEKDFTGTDIEEGPGVDVVCDLTDNNNPLPKNHYNFVICCSVFEHIPNPWVMADVISTLVKPGGSLYMNCPWVWRYHKYPDDYYRYSFKAIEYLFPQFTWSNHAYSTELPDTISFVNRDSDFDRGRAEIINQKKYLPYSIINMLGTKNA